jgi:hypothetical protein
MDKQSNSTTVPKNAIGMTQERTRERMRYLASEFVQLLAYVPGAAGLNVGIPKAGTTEPSLWLYYPVGLCLESESLTEEPHMKARRLSKELSTTLTHCYDGTFYACIFPCCHEFSVSMASDRSIKAVETPHDRCLRLSAELGTALDDWRADTGTQFYANVYRASSGRGVVFFNEESEGRA